MHLIIRSDERYHNQESWLDTRWHFSFSDYYDPRNMGWGSLRVFNDDHIAPGGLFDLHPHANFEIITLVLSGTLEHRDSHGHKGTIRADGAQVMSAGTGLMHSEGNSGKDTLHLLQIWLTPAKRGGEPAWADHAFKLVEFSDRLLPLVSGMSNVDAPLKMRQDAVIYRAKLGASRSVSHAFSKTHGYLFIISGSLSFGADTLSSGDSLRLKDEKMLTLKAGKEGADLLLFDMP